MRKKILCAVLCIALLGTGCGRTENNKGTDSIESSSSSSLSSSRSSSSSSDSSSSSPDSSSSSPDSSSSSSDSSSSSPDSSSSSPDSSSSSSDSSSSIPDSSSSDSDSSLSSSSSSSSSKPSPSSSSSSAPVQAEPEIIGAYNQRAQTSGEQAYCDEVFKLINDIRADYGLPAFKKLDKLSELAVARAWENTVSYGHTRPNGTSSFTILKENGLNYRNTAENVAAGQRTPSAVVDAWMNSEGHRNNILNPDLEYLGVGYYSVSAGYGSYWAQLFFTPL